MLIMYIATRMRRMLVLADGLWVFYVHANTLRRVHKSLCERKKLLSVKARQRKFCFS